MIVADLLILGIPYGRAFTHPIPQRRVRCRPTTSTPAGLSKVLRLALRRLFRTAKSTKIGSAPRPAPTASRRVSWPAGPRPDPALLAAAHANWPRQAVRRRGRRSGFAGVAAGTHNSRHQGRPRRRAELYVPVVEGWQLYVFSFRGGPEGLHVRCPAAQVLKCPTPVADSKR